MADIEGAKQKDLSAILLFPARKTIESTMEGSDSNAIEGTVVA